MAEEKKKRRFNWRVFTIVIAAILVVYLVLALVPRVKSVKENPFVIEQGSRPLLIAHGGGNREFPDNTLEACYNAYSVDENVMLEMDVSITRDGVVIMSHDTTLDYRTSARGAIAEWNYTDLLEQKVDFSYLNKKENGKVVEEIKYTDYQGKQVTPKDVPNYPDGLPGRDPDKFLATRLIDVLEAFPRNTVNVEIKQSGETGLKALNAVIKIVEDLDAFDRVVLASFHKEIYNELKRIHKEDHPELLFSPQDSGVAALLISGAVGLDLFYTEPVAVLQIPMSQKVKGINIHLDREWFVATAHKHNIAVHYWTIDDEDDMKYLIQIGADGIMTNLPHTLLKVYGEVFDK